MKEKKYQELCSTLTANIAFGEGKTDGNRIALEALKEVGRLRNGAKRLIREYPYYTVSHELKKLLEK